MKNNGYDREIRSNKKRKKIDELIIFFDNFKKADEENIKNINKNVQYIENNIYYKKIWNFFNKNRKINSDKILNCLKNNIPFTTNRYLEQFFAISNTYSFKFIEYIYENILKINYEEKEIITFQIFDSFYRLQDIFRKLIGDVIYNFEYFLRVMLMSIMRKNNLTFQKIFFFPGILQEKKNKEKSLFHESIKMIPTTIKDLKESNEFLEITFEEMNFQDYINLIEKLDDTSFSNLLRLFFNNTKNIIHWEFEIVNNKILNFEELDPKNLVNIKKEFINELEKIKFLRNRIYHNKTIIFKNWLNQKYASLRESIESLYKLFYSNGELQINNLKSSLSQIIEDFREGLIKQLPYKIIEIDNYLKDLI